MILDVPKIKQALLALVNEAWEIRHSAVDMANGTNQLVRRKTSEVVATVRSYDVALYISLLHPVALRELLRRLQEAEKEVRRKQTKAESFAWLIEKRHPTTGRAQYLCRIDHSHWDWWTDDPHQAVKFVDESSAGGIATMLEQETESVRITQHGYYGESND